MNARFDEVVVHFLPCTDLFCPDAFFFSGRFTKRESFVPGTEDMYATCMGCISRWVGVGGGLDRFCEAGIPNHHNYKVDSDQ